MGNLFFSRRCAVAPRAFLILVPAILLPTCAPQAASNRQIWAEVDGQPIFREQVEKQYHTRMASGSDAGNPEQALSFKLNILNELINNQILIAHASRAGIAVSEAEVDTKVAELQSPYSKEEFQKMMNDQGMELSDFREHVRHSLIINKLINMEITSHINVTDAEIADYFEHNKAGFNVPETTYHLAEIEVTPTADPQVRNLKNDDAKTPAAAERKIQALYARVRAGDDFSVVAQEYSEDPRTAVGGGDMGFIPTSSLNSNPQLKQAIGSLKVGEFSGIIRTPTGLHIIKLLGREEPGQRPLSDPTVQNTIRRTLMNEKEQLLKAAYLEDLRNRAKVVNYLAETVIAAGGSRATIK